MALAGLQHGLRMVSQPAVRFHNRIGYHDYEGITEDFGERARINKALGKNRALIMRNHGLLTVGKTAREAFVLMKIAARSRRHPARAWKRPAARWSRSPRRFAKRPRINTNITTPAAARPTGRLICACSTRIDLELAELAHGAQRPTQSLNRVGATPSTAIRRFRTHPKAGWLTSPARICRRSAWCARLPLRFACAAGG